ncbi:MAG: hypothetical protein Q9226_000768 [Calogaya cf. arnoldii]
MPRTLPWLKDQGLSQAKVARAPPAKRSRALDSDSDTSGHARSIQRAQARQRRELAMKAGRTPSTSPPPAPPSVEYMHEGLSHDDIYIMVEDEFLSAAQLFTSHLHHAEYVRLKNAAKARSSLHPTANALSRPTDSITAMRAETKRKKETDVRMGKNKAALDKMKSDARANIALDSDEEVCSEDEEDEQPWAGTSLQGLMAPAARKNLTSLSGLQSIQSSTRAANGYSKPGDASQSNRAHDPIRILPPQPAATRTHLPSASKDHRPTLRRLSEMSSSESSDDPDAPSTRPPRTSVKAHTTSHPPPPKPKPSNPLTLAAEDLLHPVPRTKQHHVRNPSPPMKHKLPDLSPPSRKDELAAARRRLEERRERAAAAAKKMDENANGNVNVNVNVNEVPVFLF